MTGKLWEYNNDIVAWRDGGSKCQLAVMVMTFLKDKTVNK